MQDSERMPNLLANILASLPAEQFTEILARPGVRIERIVSTGQADPPGQWQQQDWDEWVLLLDGAAGLAIEGESERRLGRGDHLLIPAHTRHRVSWTDPDRSTIWLAVHIGAPAHAG